jgi:hypothetical protein
MYGSTRPLVRGVCPCRTRQGADLLTTHARRFGLARHYRAGPMISRGPVVARGGLRGGAVGGSEWWCWWARWWRVVAPLVALSGGVGGPGGGHAVATRLPCLPVWMRAVLLARPYGPDTGGHVDAGLVASIQAGRTAIRRAPRGVRWLCRCGPCSIRSPVRPLVARLHSCRSPLALCSWPGHAALRCVTAGLGSSWAVGRVVQGG